MKGYRFHRVALLSFFSFATTYLFLSSQSSGQDRQTAASREIMAADAQGGDATAQLSNGPMSTEGGIKLANGYTKLPNGVVLDREGKP
jgi:hypothetical protein